MLFFPKLMNSDGKIIGQFEYPVSKVVCVGRNYSAHAKELNNPIPSEPLLFIKPTNCLVDASPSIEIPTDRGECHHELELAVLIGSKLSNCSKQKAIQSVKGIGLGLDLTLRDLQTKLKSKGQPWEKAKAFDGACPITGFIERDHFESFSDIEFSMYQNDKLAQKGNSKEMLFDIASLVQDIASHFTLFPGDVILTGTPEGVAALYTGDKLKMELEGKQIAESLVSLSGVVGE